MVALRLQRLAEAAPRVGVAELEIGPRLAELGRAPPVARLQHPRSLDPENRDPRVAIGELRLPEPDQRVPTAAPEAASRRGFGEGAAAGAAGSMPPLTPVTPARENPLGNSDCAEGSASVIDVRAHAIDSRHRLMPRDAVEPEHRGEAAYAGHRVEYARAARA